MDFNYDLSKFGKEIKINRQEGKPETAAPDGTNNDEPSVGLRIPQPKRVTADSAAINAAINRALAEGQNVKPVTVEKETQQRQTANAEGNNPFVTVKPEDDIQIDENAANIFGDVTGNVIEKDPRSITSGGIGAVDDDFDDLLEQWSSLPQDASYEDKMNLIGRIITAAQRDGNEQAVGTWSCYRFILRNNYLKEQYNNYLQQLAGNEGYGNYENYVNLVLSGDNIDWYEDLGWNEQPWEISAYFSAEDQADWEVFHDELHFGGTYELIDGSDPPAYNYTPADSEQAYVYCIAMIARYSTKILAIQVKLHDPDIINNHVLTEKLNKDIAYYRQLLNGMVAERNRLAEQLNYGNFDPDNGAFHFSVPDAGLVPGLTPPENNPTPIQYETLKKQFEALEREYEETFGNVQNPKDNAQQIAKLNELIAFASKMVQKGEEPIEYWQDKLERWQGVLAEVQNGN